MYKFFIDKHSLRSAYVTAYAYFDEIRLINEKGEVELRFEGDMDISFTNSKHHLATYRGYMRTTEKYIYIPFIGKEVLNREESRVNLADKIHVFDWQLNRVAVLNLGVELTGFDIMEEKGLIIASVDDANQSIVKFKLPDELRN